MLAQNFVFNKISGQSTLIESLILVTRLINLLMKYETLETPITLLRYEASAGINPCSFYGHGYQLLVNIFDNFTDDTIFIFN
jgi:hypothetical protein